MKRIIYFLICSILSISSIVADDSFDPRKNYQGKNVMAYLGEILYINYLPDLPEGYSKWDAMAESERVLAYKGFMNPDAFDPTFHGRFTLGSYYHFDRRWLFHGAGTKASELRDKIFYVYKIKHWDGCEWLFYMVNVNDRSDKVIYIYYDNYHEVEDHTYGPYDQDYLYNNFNNFPLTAEKYLVYQYYRR